MEPFITYSKGMKVLYPAKYGNQVMVVHSTRTIASEAEIRMALHNQHVVLETETGEVDPSTISGYYLRPAPESNKEG